MTLRIQTVEKDEFETVIPKLAALRINVFSDWPYLYEGSMTYEERYLRAYADSSGAVIVGAWQGTEVVGAATGAPMEDHAAEFPEPFIREGYNPDEIFYFGESVLLRVFRGQGAGHAFFDLRETQTKRLGRTYACFCAVIRPIDHPKRPADYSPLHAFWRKRGYRLMEGVMDSKRWKTRHGYHKRLEEGREPKRWRIVVPRKNASVCQRITGIVSP